MTTYRIVRFYANEDHPSRTVKRGLTIEEAKAWCRNPETSSRTATCARSRRITAQYGEWFDGWTEDK